MLLMAMNGSALLKAVSDCRVHQTRLLLDLGLPLSSRTADGEGVLLTALRIQDDFRRERLFNFLLRRGADCNERDHTLGRSTLAWAAFLGRSSQISRLLSQCLVDLDLVSVDVFGKTALHYAVTKADPAAVRLLAAAMVKFGVSVDLPDGQGITPLSYALKLGFLETAGILLKDGHAVLSYENVVQERQESSMETSGNKRKHLPMPPCQKSQKSPRKATLLTPRGKIDQLSKASVSSGGAFDSVRQADLIFDKDEVDNEKKNQLSELNPQHHESSATYVSLPTIADNSRFPVKTKGLNKRMRTSLDLIRHATSMDLIRSKKGHVSFEMDSVTAPVGLLALPPIERSTTLMLPLLDKRTTPNHKIAEDIATPGAVELPRLMDEFCVQTSQSYCPPARPVDPDPIYDAKVAKMAASLSRAVSKDRSRKRWKQLATRARKSVVENMDASPTKVT